MKRNRKTDQRRYYLHKKLKDFEIDIKAREIKGPYTEFQNIPVPQRYYVGQLIQMGYNYQLQLL